jgi:endo-1,4-beta-xylanase
MVILQACSLRSLQAPGSNRETSLKAAAEKLGLSIGVAVDATQLSKNSRYARIVREEFSSIVPENASKLDALLPKDSTYSFDQTDAIVAFARENKLSVHGHTLVWHRQIPNWISAKKRSSQEASKLLRNHISTVMSRYAKDIGSWDVLNEAVAARGGLHKSYWLESIGSSYIPNVFRWARNANSTAKLYYNENDIGISSRVGSKNESNSSHNYRRLVNKSEATYRLLKKLLANGVPLDGIGLQMHIRPRYTPSLEQLKLTLKRFASLGLDIRISELDVSLDIPVTEEKLLLQAEIYSEVFEACLSEPRCKSINIWGLSDAHSWVPVVFKNLDKATIFAADLQKKPAYFSILKTLNEWCQKHAADSPRCAN